MHFGTKNYLKNNRYHTATHTKLLLPWTWNLGNKTIFPVIKLYLSSASSSLALVQQIAVLPEIGSFVPSFSSQSWTLLWRHKTIAPLKVLARNPESFEFYNIKLKKLNIYIYIYIEKKTWTKPSLKSISINGCQRSPSQGKPALVCPGPCKKIKLLAPPSII